MMKKLLVLALAGCWSSAALAGFWVLTANPTSAPVAVRTPMPAPCPLASAAVIEIKDTCKRWRTELTTDVTSVAFNIAEGQTVGWHVVGSGGAHTIAFPADLKWNEGSAITTVNSGKRNLYIVMKLKGVLTVMVARKDVQ